MEQVSGFRRFWFFFFFRSLPLGENCSIGLDCVRLHVVRLTYTAATVFADDNRCVAVRLTDDTVGNTVCSFIYVGTSDDFFGLFRPLFSGRKGAMRNRRSLWIEGERTVKAKELSRRKKCQGEHGGARDVQGGARTGTGRGAKGHRAERQRTQGEKREAARKARGRAHKFTPAVCASHASGEYQPYANPIFYSYPTSPPWHSPN